MVDLYNDDCLNILNKLLEDKTKIDLFMLDPPYDIENTDPGEGSRFSKSLKPMNNDLTTKKLDITLGTTWCEYIPKLQDKINCYIWCNKKQIKKYLDYFVDELDCDYDIIVWQKLDAIPTFYNKYLTDKEYCLYFRKGGYCKPTNYDSARTVYTTNINRKDKAQYKHPTIKSFHIIENLILNSSKEGQTVCDFFMGSGTSGSVCKKHNRKFIGVEIDEEFFNIAKCRIEDTNFKENLW